MKYAVVILDGAAGWPLDVLGERTTLSAARTPGLDHLAREGTLGLARTVPPGIEPSSSAACTSILGYDPIADYVGRGAIEAASMGIVLAPGEVAMRMNLVEVRDGLMSSYSCGGIGTAEAREIVADLADALGSKVFAFHPGVGYRHILVVKGHPEVLEGRFTPPHDITGQSVAGHLPEGPGSHLLLQLMTRARDVLSVSEANAARAARGETAATDIWPFWPGTAPAAMAPFRQLRGVSAALSSGVDLLNGLAVLTGIRRLDIPGVTAGPDNDYAGQAAGALAALESEDLVVIHVESPDEAGHAGDASEKIAAIEAIDRHVVAALVDRDDLRVLCMPDHPTPIALKTHAAEPVPFVIRGPGIEANGGLSFDEVSASRTGLLLDRGRLVMDRLLA